ncbi:MAG: hypothetical protein ACTSX9_01625 [Candidatus Njordarchaeales archaeon]
MDEIRLVALIKDVCFPQSKISVKDIIDAGGLREFIEETYNKYKISPSTALRVFSVGRNKGLLEAIKILKSIDVIDFEIYFLTPFQVLTEEDLVFPYRECLDSLSIDDIKKYFEIFGVADEVLEIIESQPDILYIYANSKLVKFLKLLDYVPKGTIGILAIDTPAVSKLENLKIVYPTHKTIVQLKKVGAKIRTENFGGSLLTHIAIVLNKLSMEMKRDNFVNFIRMAKDKSDFFFEAIFGSEVYNAIKKEMLPSLLKFLKTSSQ